MTEKSELLPSSAVETAPAPVITALPVAPSPVVAPLDFSPAVGESARAQAFRDRQYALAESILEVAERQLERVDEDDLDQVSFSDVCKAVDVASRLARHARETPVADTPDQGLRDQLAALLDQVCGETLKPS